MSSSRASIRAKVHSSVPRPKAHSSSSSSKRSSAVNSRSSMVEKNDSDCSRVRVAVRLRPRITTEVDIDSSYCVELQSEVNMLKLRKNNWSSESYKFDEVLSENSSQKRVYEVVAKPVVESVLSGYNGTVMAYGQTGTGKTYTLGHLGMEDISQRGIMVRAMEDIFRNSLHCSCNVAVSYVQLYLESVQDLLDPEKNNLSITEDPKTGEVSLPGSSIMAISSLESFLRLLQVGESNRHATNTKLNTESSRSHAILMIYIQRPSNELGRSENVTKGDQVSNLPPPLLLKSKLLIVDLAGSERIDKSGSEGYMIEEAKFINRSLSSLGKCINALAENCPHIPTRDTKLTRLLRDSFGGSARTSLIITIGPSSKYHAETSSTVHFGQRAMKVVNTLKLKEEVDYESLCRKLEGQIDYLSMEVERQQKVKQDENGVLEKKLKECEKTLQEVKKSFDTKCECLKEENIRLQSENKSLLETINFQKGQCNQMCNEITSLKSSLDHIKEEKAIHELKFNLEDIYDAKEMGFNEIRSLRMGKDKFLSEKALSNEEFKSMQRKLLTEENQRKCLEDEVARYKRLCFDVGLHMEDNVSNANSVLRSTRSGCKSNRSMDTISSQRATISKILEAVGLQNVISLLGSCDLDVQIHAAKLIANLSSKESKQGMIAEEGGLDAFLKILESLQDRTILQLASVAIANLANYDANQILIMNKDGGRLLANLAYKTNDMQTLRMVAGAIANLCGNEKLHIMLKKDGVTKALLELSRIDHDDVITQIARGIANFAKCETRDRYNGKRKGKSLLIDDDVFNWILCNSKRAHGSTRRNIDLALCHLAQNEHNTSDIISSGALEELHRISEESLDSDIRDLAKKTLNLNPAFVKAHQCVGQ